MERRWMAGKCDLATGEITSRSKIVEQILEVKVLIGQDDGSGEKRKAQEVQHRKNSGEDPSDMVGKTGSQRQVRQGTHT